MGLVTITALGIGGATVVGTLVGFCFKKISHRFSDIVLAFSAGIMLSAAILGLILPSLSCNTLGSATITILGILLGAWVLSLIDRLVPHIHHLLGWKLDVKDEHVSHVLLFVAAMAIHNFPEGLAAGVGFGTGNQKTALMIAGGIALQNLPEGLVTVTPMLAAGICPRKTFLCGLATGMIEVIGTILGYVAVTVTEAILPFFLAFAGGTMLFVISDEMIPETHDHGNERAATFALIFGFCVMLTLDALLL